MKMGVVASSVAVAGWSAGLVALAPGAGAASGELSSAASYKSSASATAGGVTIAGNAVTSLLTATATNQYPDESANLGSDQLVSALNSVPALGPVLVAAFKQATPDSANVLTESATASPDGTSSACAAILAGACTPGGTVQPLVLKLDLADLNAALQSAVPSSAKVKLPPSPLADYAIVLSITGPEATCAAGPAGSGRLSAASDLARISVDLQDNGKSMLPNGPIGLDAGDLFTQLLSAVRGSPLAPLLTSLSGSLPLTLTVSPDSRKSTSGSTATATTGEVGLSALGTTVFDIKSATVTCGPNTKAAESAPGGTASASPSVTPTAAAAPSSNSISGEIPLHEIQTDEGRLPRAADPGGHRTNACR